ncbi:MAG: hypothetical protein GY869_13090 [Planctomycetes bacterium]|nr:hypothetical protein [Planctomycetota bacterium]
MGNWPASAGRIIPLLLAVVSTFIAVTLLTYQDHAAAQNALQNEAIKYDASNNTSAFPIQLGAGIEGIALIDHQNKTICIYQYELRRAAHERFALVAARDFSYDSRLTNYNNANPTPEMVKQWVQRAPQTQDPNQTGVKIIKNNTNSP